MYRVIRKGNYSDALNAVAAVIAAREIDLDKKHILIVPDKYTLAAEKLLFSERGAFDAEVLTFARLFYRLSSPAEYLSREGAVMLIQDIADETKLEYFERSKRFRGFAVKIYDTICQLMASRVPPDALKGGKLDDVACLYARYLERVRGRYVDAGGRMELMIKAAEQSAFFDNAHVYAANFDVYTGQMKALLGVIERRALSLTVSQTDCSRPVTAPVEVYAAANRADGVKRAALLIREASKETDLSDMAVVMPREDFHRARRIFGEYGLPCFVDLKKSLADYPYFSLLKRLVGAVRRTFDREDMIELSKNFYFGFDKRAADHFELYCNARAVEHGGFEETFDDEEAEIVRSTLMRFIGAFKARAESLDGAADFVSLLRYIDDELSIREITARLYNEAYMDKVYELGEVMEKIGVGGGADQLFDVFFAGMRAAQMGYLPSRLGQIVIGEPSAFRGSEIKYLFLLDCAEGKLPCLIEESGILTDRDIDDLTLRGVIVEPKTADVNLLEESELRSLLSSAAKIFVSYDESSPLKRSRFIDELNFDFGYREDPSLLDERELLLLCSDRRAAEELLIGCLAGEGATPWYLSGLSAAVGEGINKFLIKKPSYISRGEKMLGSVTYISQLQSFFDCPYKHYLCYGLRLEPVERGELTPADVGTLLHLIVEKIVSSGDFSDLENRARAIAEETAGSERKYRLGVNARLLDSVVTEAAAVIAILARHLRKGAFTGVLTETAFGLKGARLSPLKLSDDLSLCGKIDMMDFCGNYVRVVDYKTGYSRFDYKDIYTGRKIQLPLYLKTMTENGFLPAGMFFFPFKYSWKDKPTSHRFDGVFAFNDDIPFLMDSTLAGGAKSEVVKARTVVKDGRPIFDRYSAGLTSAQLTDVCDYASRIALSGARLIREGCVAPSPAASGAGTACDYCDFAAICPGGAVRASPAVDIASFKEVL